MTKLNATETVETLIDQHGLLHILTAIELVCDEKAEHIRVNWQDRATASYWDRAGRAIHAAARKVEPLNI